jgi:hypothetical protein
LFIFDHDLSSESGFRLDPRSLDGSHSMTLPNVSPLTNMHTHIQEARLKCYTLVSPDSFLLPPFFPPPPPEGDAAVAPAAAPPDPAAAAAAAEALAGGSPCDERVARPLPPRLSSPPPPPPLPVGDGDVGARVMVRLYTQQPPPHPLSRYRLTIRIYIPTMEH